MRIIINGVCGRMGGDLLKIVRSGYKNAEFVAGVDINPDGVVSPVYDKIGNVREEADCIIDFSHHTSVNTMLPYALERNLPVVIATTGHTADELALIKQASESIPVFHSANMSLGVALLVELAKTAAKSMPDAEIEIIEKHHDRKLDSPSGTAIMIANAIKEVRENAYAVLGRSGNGKRTHDEIGIHAVRLGNIIGEHEVLIGTDSQTITLKHEAHTRSLFSEGALTAAEFIIGKDAGLYNMQSLING